MRIIIGQLPVGTFVLTILITLFSVVSVPEVYRLMLENIQLIKSYLLDLQNRICKCLEQEDGQTKFKEDQWAYQAGDGGGLTRILTNGPVIEKAGVNFSHIKAKELPQAATTKRPEFAHSAFQALGVSVVVHPYNPYVPTCHFNVRFITVENLQKQNQPYWWFGGGFDLTPYYGFVEDCIHWHRMAKNACDPFGKDVYKKYKKWADDYFNLKHRNERRGIGGLFFDELNQWDFVKCFDFMRQVGEHFIKAYQPILQKRKHHEFQQKEKDFQHYRRGRYVEFNLLYDRGTLFGLQSDGRTESILMSLPPLVTWKYNYQPEAGSPEAALYEEFLKVKECI